MDTNKKQSFAQITLETMEVEEEPTNFGFSALNGKFRGLERKYKLMQEEINTLQDKISELTAKMGTIIKALRR